MNKAARGALFLLTLFIGAVVGVAHSDRDVERLRSTGIARNNPSEPAYLSSMEFVENVSVDGLVDRNEGRCSIDNRRHIFQVYTTSLTCNSLMRSNHASDWRVIDDNSGFWMVGHRSIHAVRLYGKCLRRSISTVFPNWYNTPGRFSLAVFHG